MSGPARTRPDRSAAEPPDPLEILRDRFGHPAFRPGQEALARACLTGRDALGVLPTGGGKSVCFQLPAFLLPGTVIVVSPLISLMADHVGRARSLGLRADFLNSTQERDRQESVVSEAVGGRLDVLFLAPERFRVPAFRASLRRIPVSVLAVDEAHCISEWGHDFRPDYADLGDVRGILDAPVLAVTATATPPVRDEIERSLRLREPVRVVLGFDRPNLSWSVLPVRTHRERIRVLHRLLRDRGGGAAIIYASTRRAVEAVRRDLSRLGHPVRGYHAGMADEQRSRVQEEFVAGGAPVVVATNAFGMGIDRPDVRLVAHYQLPGSLEAYYQEAGRAGRDGDAARCVALFRGADLAIHRRFARAAHPPRRTLLRVLRFLRSRIGVGSRGRLPLEAVGDVLGGAAGPGEAAAALRALERCGAVRLFACPEAGESTLSPSSHAPVVDLGLHGSEPALDLELRLGRRARERVEAVERFARGRGCRRRTVLEYFGDSDAPARCGACDRCAPHLFSPYRLR